jgi:hypothetical protein
MLLVLLGTLAWLAGLLARPGPRLARWRVVVALVGLATIALALRFWNAG